MRIQLTWPNAANACLTLTFALPDLSSDSLRPTLQRVLTYAGPLLAGAADAAGAGLLARLILPLAVHIVQQTLESDARISEHGPDETPFPMQVGHVPKLA
ncbi:hypothetical protein [Streptomyces sp. NPDC093097]|uniref:hypothetical protein n=1 Tax=Streptomyces sp. NPDC093097 TaxID=3366027 RepID=UPI003822663B